MAANVAVEGTENDMYVAGQRLAYTNALAIVLEACACEYIPGDGGEKVN